MLRQATRTSYTSLAVLLALERVTSGPGRANECQEALAYGNVEDHRTGRRGDGPAHDFGPALDKKGNSRFDRPASPIRPEEVGFWSLRELCY